MALPFWAGVLAQGYEVPDIRCRLGRQAMASLVALQPGEKGCKLSFLSKDWRRMASTSSSPRVMHGEEDGLRLSNVMSRGIIAINIDKDDELINAGSRMASRSSLFATHVAMAIRFNEPGLTSYGAPATGNRGISLRKGDYVMGRL